MMVGASFALFFLVCCSAYVKGIKEDAASGVGANLLAYPDALVTAVSGSGGRLTCIAYGNPRPRVAWLKDNTEIQNGSYSVTIYETFIEETNVSFTQSIFEICSFLPEHEGNYSCFTENGFGNSSILFHIDVIFDEVSILVSPNNTIANTDDVISFFCSASGIPLPSISWFKDGIPLDYKKTVNISSNISNNGTLAMSELQLGELQLADAGQYHCNASHVISGTDTREFTLTVERTVLLVVYPSNTSISAGAYSSYICIATGIPSPQISWLKDGRPIIDANITQTVFLNVSSYFAVSILNLCDLGLSDSGLYSCLTSNNISQGQAQANSSFFLEVQDSPNISTAPVKQTVIESSDLELSCTVSGVPLPQVSWWMTTDGVRSQVTEDNVTMVVEDLSQESVGLVRSILTVLYVDASVAGVYECMATNSLGSDTAQALVTVYVPPYVVGDNEDIAYNGSLSSIQLICIAGGFPLPDIVWYKNGTLLDNDVNFEVNMMIQSELVMTVLNLFNITFSVAGVYECIASNTLFTGSQNVSGADGRLLNLTVLGEPVWVVHPTPDVIVPAGQTFSLNCTATGFPNPSIVWLRLRASVPSSTTATTAVLNPYTTFASLAFGPFVPQWAGTYLCYAEGETISGMTRSVPSRTTQVSFTSPPHLRVALSDHAVFRTMDITITCQFQSFPASNVSWTYVQFNQNSAPPVQLLTGNNYNITTTITTARYYYVTTSVLFIRSVTIDNAGEYSCSGTNGVANLIEAVSTGVSRLFYEMNDLVFVTTPDDTVVVAGSMASLRCAAVSNSSLTLYWTKNGINVTLPGTVEVVNDVTSYYVTFTDAVSSDTGYYTCYARSEFYQRSISSSANLVVFVPASIVDSPNNSAVLIGTSVSFSCLANGSHNLTIVWTKDGAVLSSGITQQSLESMKISVLELTNVGLSQAGTYGCTASNGYPELPQASDEIFFNLLVQRAPLVMPIYQVQAAERDKISIINIPFQIVDAVPVVAEEDIHPNFTRYDGTLSSFNFSQLNFTIENADIFEHEGNYTVSASNPAGSSLGTVDLDIKSGPVTFSLNVSGEVMYDSKRTAYVAFEDRSVMFSCSFSADPEPSVEWLQDGRPIQTQQTNKYMATYNFKDTRPIGSIYSQLTLLNIVEADSGNYSCQGANAYGVDGVSQRLAVLVPPTVTPLSAEVFGVENRDGNTSKVTLGFSITRAKPAVSLGDITWTYTRASTMEKITNLINHIRVGDTKFKFADDLLYVTVMNLSLFDAGIFTMSARNEVGASNATVQLTIHVEPELLNSTYSGNETSERNDATFMCVADGLPLPRIIWIHNGTLIFNSKRRPVNETEEDSMNRPHVPKAMISTLKVLDLQLKDAGSYMCRVDPVRIGNGRPSFSTNFSLTVNPAPIDYCKSSPCKNGGVCSNVTLSYLCTCDPMKWKGVNCTIVVYQFIKPIITKDPVVKDFPEIFTPVTLTCEVMGSPEPSITWFKDGRLLEGEKTLKLTIQEMGLLDRGYYYCEASNYDPRYDRDDDNKFSKDSKNTILNIKGIAQYRATLNNVIVSRRRKRMTEANAESSIVVMNLASRLSGVSLAQNTTIYSVNVDTTYSGNAEAIPIIITLIAPNGGSLDVTTSLANHLEITGEDLGLTFTNVSRFDGCRADTTVIPPLETAIVLNWPETDLGIYFHLPCPCGNLSSVSKKDISKEATRMCGGNFTHGAKWSLPNDAPCDFSATTRRLCQVANLINMPNEAIETLDNITKNEDMLGSTEIEVTTILLEALIVGVEKDEALSNDFLLVVDNLLDADSMDIQMSQAEANTSARILEVVEDVAEGIPIPENGTSVILSLTSFAISVQNVELETFTGQVFSAQLGSDFIFDDDEKINDTSLGYSMSSMDTAALRLPDDVFINLDINSSDPPRIVNTLFLTDKLFPRRKESKLKVGSIIIAASISGNVDVENLLSPIIITFRKRPSVLNGTNASCNFWDLSADDGFGDWSSRGCKLVNETETHVTCECNHLTNFAMLLDPKPVTPNLPPAVVKTLDAISYIGAIVSIFCLLITIATYLSSQKLRKSEPGRLLMNLCLALLGLYIMFIVSLHGTANRFVCAVAGGLLHYFMLATFLAMAVEAVSLFTKLVLVLGIPPFIKHRFVLKAFLITWIPPIIIVVLSEAPKWTNYVSTFFCRPFGASFYAGLMTPFIIIYLFNWIVFIAIFASLLKKKSMKADSKKDSKFNFRQNFIIAVMLSLLFGLGWGIGLASTTSISNKTLSTLLQVLFILLTGFQGLFIFVMHCVRSEDARKQWKAWASTITCHKVKFTARQSTSAGHSSIAAVNYGYKGTHGRFNKYSMNRSTLQTNTDTLKSIPDSSCSPTVMNSVTDMDKKIFLNPTFDDVCEEKYDLSAASPLSKDTHFNSAEEHMLQDITLNDSNLAIPGQDKAVNNNFNILWVEKDSETDDKSSDHQSPPTLGLTLNSEPPSVSTLSEKEAESSAGSPMEMKQLVDLSHGANGI